MQEKTPVLHKLVPLAIARDSHYVPMAALRRWSTDGTHLFAYRILVPTPKIPEWRRRSIRGVAYQRDLYTVFTGDHEADDFERWISSEYEQPGLEAIDRLLHHLQLTPDDWQNIIRFVASQDIRTPLSFFESMRRWEQQIPEILDRTIQESVKRLEKAKEKGELLERKSERNEFYDIFKVTIEPPADSSSDQAVIRAEVPIGRRMWIASMRHLLTGVAETLCLHRWSVAEPAGDAEWPLTDHPVLKLNFDNPGHYDFGGGWGKHGSEIMMPVSPRHLLYVRVGTKVANRFKFSYEQTQLVQRLLVERAHRWVFATRPTEWVAGVRPRTVDLEKYVAEAKAWKEWHKDQSQSEKSSTG
jgi:hypothetical protein